MNFHQNTKITVNRVDYQALEKLENGLIGSQQESRCHINTTRGKARQQDTQT